MSEPLPRAASTTSTPRDNPLMRRFRRGKFPGAEGVPRGNSVTMQPSAASSCREASCCVADSGCRRRCPSPRSLDAAPARPPHGAAASMPSARPLTMVSPASESACAIASRVLRAPVAVALRLPTIANRRRIEQFDASFGIKHGGCAVHVEERRRIFLDPFTRSRQPDGASHASVFSTSARIGTFARARERQAAPTRFSMIDGWLRTTASGGAQRLEQPVLRAERYARDQRKGEPVARIFHLPINVRRPARLTCRKGKRGRSPFFVDATRDSKVSALRRRHTAAWSPSSPWRTTSSRTRGRRRRGRCARREAARDCPSSFAPAG